MLISTFFKQDIEFENSKELFIIARYVYIEQLPW